MSLISQADPYEPEPLEDSPEEVARIAELAVSGTPYQSQMSSLAGKWYAEFVHEINDAKEAKEIALIQLVVWPCPRQTLFCSFTHSFTEQSQYAPREAEI